MKKKKTHNSFKTKQHEVYNTNHYAGVRSLH